jgi:DNA-binding IclR family transcriptional regulator
LLDPHAARGDLRRRRERTSRLIAKLRGHGLVAKVPRSRRYHVTARGHRLLSAVLRFRQVDFPHALAVAA